MGEFALYRGERVKIGTCDSMYYLRWEDRHKVKATSGSVNPVKDLGLRFRLPFPDEDNEEPGGYCKQPFARGSVLAAGFSFPDSVENPGTVQMHHGGGLLVNVKCYHGEKLPEGNQDFSAAWNGKSPSHYELRHVKTTQEGVIPVIGCRWCREMWRSTWDEVLPHLDAEMHVRLKHHAEGCKENGAG